MSNHGETTPSGNQPPDPRAGGGNNTPVDNTPVGNTSQDRAIIITDGEPVVMRRPISNSPPVFISNEELLKELHNLRSEAREQQALRERVAQLESLVPGTLPESNPSDQKVSHAITRIGGMGSFHGTYSRLVARQPSEEKVLETEEGPRAKKINERRHIWRRLVEISILCCKDTEEELVGQICKP